MIIKKFQGKTEEEAKKKAKDELGEHCVYMNTRELKPKGMFKSLKSSTFEVTAALEEKDETKVGTITKPTPVKDSINLAADEDIVIPPPEKEFKLPELAFRPVAKSADAPKKEDKQEDKRVANPSIIMEDDSEDKEFEDSVEKRIQSMNSILDEKNPTSSASLSNEDLKFLRLIYSTLLKNEVNEQYANQIVDEIERTIRPGNNMDMILSNVYQKLILRLGRPQPITLNEKTPKVIFFIGPTGVGKTTTIAKISSKAKLEEHKNIAFITADTYRIAATEQLNVYAEILKAPLKVVYSSEEMNQAIEEFNDMDLIFVDTAGFSHKNMEQKSDIHNLIANVSEEISKEVYLVLSATTKYADLKKICDAYKEISEYKLIFTKLDETDAIGNILNIRLYTQAELSYITTGQNVPNDMEILDTQKIVKQLLGGN